MTIPDFQTLMRPNLSYLADGQHRSTRTVTDAMSVAGRTPPGTRPRRHNSAQWFEAAMDVVGQVRPRTVLTNCPQDHAYLR
jgi:restriction endonuclease Mrr